MVNMNTIRFYLMLQELAEMFEHGAIPFSQYNADMKEAGYEPIIYDDLSAMIDADSIEERFLICADTQVDDEHHDIISYYPYVGENEFKIEFAISSVCTPWGEDLIDRWIEVTHKESGEQVIIEDGRIYNA